jgi:hypothetical protein
MGDMLVGMCLPDVLGEVSDANVEGDAMGAWVDAMGPSFSVVLGDVKAEVGLVSKFLRAVRASVVYWASGGSVLWHRLVGVEPMGDLVAELVGLNEVVIVFLAHFKLAWALRDKGAGMSSTLWM